MRRYCQICLRRRGFVVCHLTVVKMREVPATYSLSNVGCAHVDQFVPVVMLGSPLELFKDKLHALLKVQGAKIDAVYATCRQLPNHVGC